MVRECSCADKSIGCKDNTSVGTCYGHNDIDIKIFWHYKPSVQLLFNNLLSCDLGGSGVMITGGIYGAVTWEAYS